MEVSYYFSFMNLFQFILVSSSYFVNKKNNRVLAHELQSKHSWLGEDGQDGGVGF